MAAAAIAMQWQCGGVAVWRSEVESWKKKQFQGTLKDCLDAGEKFGDDDYADMMEVLLDAPILTRLQALTRIQPCTRRKVPYSDFAILHACYGTWPDLAKVIRQHRYSCVVVG